MFLCFLQYCCHDSSLSRVALTGDAERNPSAEDRLRTQNSKCGFIPTQKFVIIFLINFTTVSVGRQGLKEKDKCQSRPTSSSSPLCFQINRKTGTVNVSVGTSCEGLSCNSDLSSLSRPLSVTRCQADMTPRRWELSGDNRERGGRRCGLSTPRGQCTGPWRRAHMIGSHAWKG